MYELIAELGLETIPTYNDGDIVSASATAPGGLRAARGDPAPEPSRSPTSPRARCAGLARKVDLAEPWRTPGARELDGQTFPQLGAPQPRAPAGRAYFELYCDAVFSADLSDISLLHALFYTLRHRHGHADGRRPGRQQDRIAGGSWRISERMAADLDVRLGDPVRTVQQTEDGVRVTTAAARRTTPRGRHHAAADPRRPPEYDPPLPSWRDQLTQKPLGQRLQGVRRSPDALLARGGSMARRARTAARSRSPSTTPRPATTAAS